MIAPMTDIDGGSPSDAPGQDPGTEKEEGGLELIDLSDTDQIESAPTSKM